MRSSYLENAASSRGITKGDGGIFSTVDDLLKWDQALYTDQLIRQSTLAEAFIPGRVAEGTSTYGFGWNITEVDGSKYVWHTGNTANFRAFIGRRLGPKLTVIILTNKGNSRRVEISDAVFNILNGKPYVAPKLSIAAQMNDVIKKGGVEAGLQWYATERKNGSGVYDFSEAELNSLVSLFLSFLFGLGQTRR